VTGDQKVPVAQAISCTQVTKHFGAFAAVADLDLQVEPGTVLGYIGPNGAGKSTTIRMLLGLSRPTRGQVRVFGLDPGTDPTVRARIGYSPGEVRLDEGLTVSQTLKSWSRLRTGVDPKLRRELVDRFEVKLDKPVRGLSTGNRRKLCLVGAFMARPDLLILDEPTNGLDPLMQEVFVEVATEAKREGATILLSSHIMSEVERIADSVAVLRDGRLVATGPTAQMRHGAAQRFKVEFAESRPPIADLMQLNGATSVVADGSTLVLDWSGPPTELIKVLARYPVASLTAPEPDLEHAFFAHYQPGETAPPEEHGNAGTLALSRSTQDQPAPSLR
jgi:ABC-2 type transport system ATP-binding protein